MSEPKLISPMLDDFAMGDPISNHHGVRCCPAMERDSDNKYIVKIISIPASQVQLDALLLTGAYKSQGAALAYFKELSEEVVEEVRILQRLSKLEGFIAYEGHQIVPMENEVGYDVYLLSRYKHSLERFFRRNNMTHLGAVNLGLDLCAAMAVCRKYGYLYIDLKPGNIFISQDNEYRISDLGFVPLRSLKYASMPDKYRSAYTAPEIKDAFSSLNDTVDIYAIGLILYQAYNGGVLPFEKNAPEDALPAPPYADYEMAEIILKACAPDPADRWHDPLEMGQALVDYMQRNSVTDTPIITKTEPNFPPLVVEESVSEELPAESQDADSTVAYPIPDTEEETSEAITEEVDSLASEPESEPATEEESVSSEAAEELQFMDSLVSDETAPDALLDGDISYEALSDDLSDILSAADELLSHETPAPAVAPEPIEVEIPVTEEPVNSEELPSEEPASEAQSDTLPESDDDGDNEDEDDEDGDEDGDEEEDDSEEDDDDYGYEDDNQEKKRSGKSALLICIAVILAGLLIVGGYFFYRDFYVQSIESISLSGTETQLQVELTTQVDNSLLTIHCVDTFGNKTSLPVTNNTALFENLKPNSIYTITVEISGFHKLVGKTSGSFTTPAQTNIVQFGAVTGATDGSVLLTLTVDGQKSANWIVSFIAEGEEERQERFSGTMITLNGLTTGKEYTFRISSEDGLYITGQSELIYTPQPLVYAENLTIASQPGGKILATWNAPADMEVENWTVHCYNDEGYDQTITTTELQAVFTDVNTSVAHTVEVTAAGMSTGRQAYMTDNSVTVYDLNSAITEQGEIFFTWEHEGNLPDSGWLLMYTIDSSEHQHIAHCDGNSATVPAAPGSTYHFTLQSSDGATVFGGNFSIDVPEAEPFNDYYYFYMNASEITGKLVLTPDFENWDLWDLEEDDYTNTFTLGQQGSIVMRCSHLDYSNSSVNLQVSFIVRDAYGDVISIDSETHLWHPNLWSNGASYLDIPTMPEVPGEYNVTVYYNGAYVLDLDFTVS